MDGQEEAWPAAEPAPIGRESAAGDEAMDVRMMGERLAPWVGKMGTSMPAAGLFLLFRPQITGHLIEC
jgi:hypothetical protein